MLNWISLAIDAALQKADDWNVLYGKPVSFSMCSAAKITIYRDCSPTRRWRPRRMPITDRPPQTVHWNRDSACRIGASTTTANVAGMDGFALKTRISMPIHGERAGRIRDTQATSTSAPSLHCTTGRHAVDSRSMPAPQGVRLPARDRCTVRATRPFRHPDDQRWTSHRHRVFSGPRRAHSIIVASTSSP
ncbi:hypothetical protein ACYX7E_18285 [Luteimonas sp. RIT-PG2_3]